MYFKRQHLIFILTWIVGMSVLIGCQSATVTSSEPEGAEQPVEEAIVEETAVSAVPEAPSPTLNEEIEVTRPWKIAYVIKTSQPKWLYWVRVGQGAEQAGQNFGVEVLIVGPDAAPSPDNVELQIALVDELIEQGDLDGLIIGPMDSNRIVPVVEKAIAAGIPVIAQSTPVNSNNVLTFVAEGDKYKGQFVGEWVVNQLNGEGNVLILGGPPQQQNAVNRRNSIVDALSQNNINILNVADTDWSVESGYEITASWLEQYNEIDAIVAIVDNLAVGARQALEEAGRENIILTGFGAHDPLLVKSGQITATIDQTPDLQAQYAIQLMIRHLETGETFEPAFLLQDAPFLTQDNIDTHIAER